MILYLHGFRSSPASFKAQLISNYLHYVNRDTEYFCPQLPASPKLAIEMATKFCYQINPKKLTIIGSSLGGYYATYLAEQFDCRAVLLNPATNPSRDLISHMGVSTMYYSKDVFEFKQEYVDELAMYAVEKITQPERYFLVAAMGDEILNWNDMVQHYRGANQLVIEGSDHGLSDFAAYFEQILAFCDAA